VKAQLSITAALGSQVVCRALIIASALLEAPTILKASRDKGRGAEKLTWKKITGSRLMVNMSWTERDTAQRQT
jgi:hypothetical protein